MFSLRRWSASSIACALVLVASTSSATPNFPGVVASHLKLGAPPDCTLCHVGTPARATVTTAFGVALRSRGAQAYDEASLRTALDALEAEKKDSDNDGIADVIELRAGESPNGAGADVVQPEYGCAASPPRSPPRDERWLLVGLFVMASVFARRARRPGDEEGRAVLPRPSSPSLHPRSVAR